MADTAKEEPPAALINAEQVDSDPTADTSGLGAEEMTAGEASKKVKALVIDTNAIVHGMSLIGIADEYYTCQSVMNEIRSSHSRDFLTRLPFEIKVETPTEESIKAIIAFAKKTGDFAVLSRPDIEVIALAHTLEIRKNGGNHIRKEPLKQRPTGSLPSAPPPPPRTVKKAEENVGPDEDGWEQVPTKKKAPPKTSRKAKSKSQSVEKLAKETAASPSTSMTEEEAPKATAQGVTEVSEAPAQQSDVEQEDAIASVTSAMGTVAMEDVPELHKSDGDDDDEEDAGEWITPENLIEFKSKALGVTADALRATTSLSVACTTADFAMQNVLLQMNMNLVSPSGYRIKRVNNWVLRCHGCYAVTSDSEKKFCPRCGNATLRRVSCSTDSKGNVRYHLKPGFVHNLRGTKYDIPRPKGGRQHNNIVIAEDQKEYVKAQQSKQKKQVMDMFDPDFVPIYGKTNTREVGNNMYGTDVVGFGRRNPNASRKRTGKKKSSK